jgi:virginiamycin B lyase
VAGGHIYWTNYPFGVGSRHDRAAIGRANLDGTGVNQRFIRTVRGPCGVAAYKDHIYWGQTKGAFAHPSTTIGRANLDGSAVNAQFITGIHDICFGLAVG